MARLPDLEVLCAEHGLKMCSVEQVIEHRLKGEGLVSRMSPEAGTEIETPAGTFRLIAMRSTIDALPHIALCVGDVGRLDDSGRVAASDEPALVRVHRRDLLGDIFEVSGGEQDEASRGSLMQAMQMIQQAGRGALVY